jgi:hypothetical protein
MTTDWQTRFRQVYDRGIAAWHDARRTAATMFDREDSTFLATLGCTTQELFDFVEDWAHYGEPDFDTTLALAASRRDYFLEVLKGQSTGRTWSMDDLPAKTAEVDGMAWLPRLIVKARWKLRGEMPSDLMFGCRGDRLFLRKVNMTSPEFLRLVWEKADDERGIIDAVKRAAGMLV